MAAPLQTEDLMIEDMNGPLAYWGPVTPVRPAALSPAEQRILLRLRDRLEAAGTASLNTVLDGLLAADQLAAVAA